MLHRALRPPRAWPFLATAVLALLAPTVTATPLTIVGTNDLHGRVERVAALSGHLSIIRAEAKKAGGGVVLVDAGDMFQGTLESNLKEGAAVVAAYNHVGYDAVCIGNHEFDFGPVGSDVVVKKPGDDPRGALKARAAEAKFPFLAANVIDSATGQPVAWPNVKPTTIVKAKAGPQTIPVGIIGLSTVDTPKTTIYSNVADLRFSPLAETVKADATALRAEGARVVVVVAHAGGKCEHGPAEDLSSCDADAEIMRLARELPPGLVDVIIAGHTHQSMAHIVNGIPILESWANGRGFGRIDLDVDLTGATPTTVLGVRDPRRVCGDDKSFDSVDIDACKPAAYDGQLPRIDSVLLKKISPWFAGAKKLRRRKLGVIVDSEIRRGYDAESTLGNLFADLMLASAPGADVALMNGGGIRSNLPPGPLTYGAVFEMMPFDNRRAMVTMSVADLRAVLKRNLSGSKKGGILSTAGIQATVLCDDLGAATVTVTRADGRPLTDDTILQVVTTDFVAQGGDGGLGVAADKVVVDEGEPLREELVARLKARGGHLRGDDPALFDPAHPRLHRPGAATARCEGH